MMIYLQLTAAAGLLASAYALSVKYKIARREGYTPICDISRHISCSKAFASSYSATMGVPNPVGGIIYYLLVLLLTFFGKGQKIIIYLTVPPLLFSLYLAYISYIKQRNFCLVCSFVYLVNLSLMVFALELG